ncbi:hypothetical protein PF003_g38810 [Phytophthora fragariae]|nr:hypothetical protein PF003_g38810 [Phytophthora fragariae]
MGPRKARLVGLDTGGSSPAAALAESAAPCLHSSEQVTNFQARNSDFMLDKARLGLIHDRRSGSGASLCRNNSKLE